MGGSINDVHNIIGLSHLMKDDKANPDINIDELERSIINGEKDIEVEEVDLVNQYKSELARLSSQYGVELNDDGGNVSESILNGGSGSGIGRDSSFTQPIGRDSSFTQPIGRDSSFSRPIGRDSSFSRPIGRDQSFTRPIGRDSSFTQPIGRDQDNSDTFDDYKFQSKNSRYDDYNGDTDFMDDRRSTHDQTRRQHVRHVFNNMNGGQQVKGLSPEEEYEDKQMLLSAIDDLRDDLTQIGIDISRVKEVDVNNSMAEIRDVYNKLIYKNNSNNYSNFADELFLLGAQAAEYLFDGEKDWFGHKPDLTGWTNTVRGKLRRMRYTKTQIVRKIVDDYQIPAWLQIGLEVVPSAFTHSRHRKTAVRDSVVNNATYQSAIHDLNNIMTN